MWLDLGGLDLVPRIGGSGGKLANKWRVLHAIEGTVAFTLRHMSGV